MTTDSCVTAPAWRRPPIPIHAALWSLTFGVAVVAAALLTMLPAAPPTSPPVTLSWLVLAVGFAVTEVTVVRLQLGGSSHVLSLTEVVLVVGLFLSPATDTVLGLVVGTGLMLVVRRPRPVVKLAFNLAQIVLGAALATIVFASVVGDAAQPTGPRGWIGALLAVLVISVVSDVLIFAGISITEQRVTWRLLPEMLAMSVPFSLGTSAIALVAVRAFWGDWASMLLLVPPVLLVLLGYRALSAARRDRSNMAFLHEVSTLLHSQEGLEPVLEKVLATSRATFRADVAEITLLGPEEATTARCIGVKPRVEWEALSGPARSSVDELLALVGDGRLLRGWAGRGTPPVAAAYAGARGLKDLMAVALEGDRLHGVLLVGLNEGAVTRFDDPDASLLRTLATQVGRVLDNGHLEQSLVQVTELKEQLAYRANHDHLTGLANRSRFLDLVREALAHSGAGGDPACSAVSVLYLDLDGFKAVNDTFGHDTGDALLQVVAARLRACVRVGDVVARLGGDEFAVMILHDADSTEIVLGTADRIRSLVCEPVQLQDHVMTVGTSIGSSTTEVTAAITVDDLISRADAAMYVAKRAGGSRHVSYADEVAETSRPSYTGNDLLTALEQDQVFVQYQPIIDLATGDLLGAEALARWQHPVDGLVPPDVFVPLAETSGHAARLARHVMRQACGDARSWLELPGAPDLFVTVNLSATQLADADLLEDVVSALRESGLAARHLLLEITESMLMRDPHTAVQTLAALKDLGVRLAIDDFGTGYSSLAYLRQFSVDILKIAREFTAELGTGVDDDAVTRAIIQLSRTLGLRTIAEGIETSDQHSRLTELGCEWGQGFLFARPLPQEEIRDLVLFSPPRAPQRVPTA